MTKEGESWKKAFLLHTNGLQKSVFPSPELLQKFKPGKPKNL